MSQSEQLAKRFREVLLTGKWIANTNFKAQLSDVTWQEATIQIHSLNSIAKLTFHVNYYIAGLIDFFETGKLDIRDKYSFDMPPIQSEHDWRKLVDSLINNSEKFARFIKAMDANKLSEVFVDPNYGDHQRNIDGMIEHAYYHLGQVSLIKKLLRDQ